MWAARWRKITLAKSPLYVKAPPIPFRLERGCSSDLCWASMFTWWTQLWRKMRCDENVLPDVPRVWFEMDNLKQRVPKHKCWLWTCIKHLILAWKVFIAKLLACAHTHTHIYIYIYKIRYREILNAQAQKYIGRNPNKNLLIENALYRRA